MYTAGSTSQPLSAGMLFGVLLLVFLPDQGRPYHLCQDAFQRITIAHGSNAESRAALLEAASWLGPVGTRGNRGKANPGRRCSSETADRNELFICHQVLHLGGPAVYNLLVAVGKSEFAPIRVEGC